MLRKAPRVQGDRNATVYWEERAHGIRGFHLNNLQVLKWNEDN